MSAIIEKTVINDNVDHLVQFKDHVVSLETGFTSLTAIQQLEGIFTLENLLKNLKASHGDIAVISQDGFVESVAPSTNENNEGDSKQAGGVSNRIEIGHKEAMVSNDHTSGSNGAIANGVSNGDKGASVGSDPSVNTGSSDGISRHLNLKQENIQLKEILWDVKSSLEGNKGETSSETATDIVGSVLEEIIEKAMFLSGEISNDEMHKLIKQNAEQASVHSIVKAESVSSSIQRKRSLLRAKSKQKPKKVASRSEKRNASSNKPAIGAAKRKRGRPRKSPSELNEKPKPKAKSRKLEKYKSKRKVVSSDSEIGSEVYLSDASSVEKVTYKCEMILDESGEDPDYSPNKKIKLEKGNDTDEDDIVKRKARKKKTKGAKKKPVKPVIAADSDDEPEKEPVYVSDKDFNEQCKVCGIWFSARVEFYTHIHDHKEHILASCLKCKWEFNNNALAIHHKCTHTIDKSFDKRLFACEPCKQKFYSQAKYREHFIDTHSKSSKFTYFCLFCAEEFKVKLDLYKHIKTHKDICTMCGEVFTTLDNYKQHVVLHISKASHWCDRCGEVFKAVEHYDQHVEAHKMYDCPRCNAVHSTKKALECHWKHEHSEDDHKQVACEHCNKSFITPGQLEVHIRIHTGEKPYMCHLCNCDFRTNKGLAKHMNTVAHLKKAGLDEQNRKYLCNICGAAYHKSYYLQRHMKVHMDVKPHKCPHCEYRSTEKDNLKRHIDLHFNERKYVCELCGAAFHVKRTLEEHHIYKHQDIRPFLCSVCSLTFKTKHALRRHEIIHQSEKPHKCSHCQMTFCRMYALRRHLISVHNDHSMPEVHKVRLIDVPEGQEHAKGARGPAVVPGTKMAPPVQQPNKQIKQPPKKMIKEMPMDLKQTQHMKIEDKEWSNNQRMAHSLEQITDVLILPNETATENKGIPSQQTTTTGVPTFVPQNHQMGQPQQMSSAPNFIGQSSYMMIQSAQQPSTIDLSQIMQLNQSAVRYHEPYQLLGNPNVPKYNIQIAPQTVAENINTAHQPQRLIQGVQVPSTTADFNDYMTQQHNHNFMQ